MDIIIIAAMAENRVIGKGNTLPWQLKEDLVRFRELTWGWPCVMGRNTWESLPKRPLPGRENIVISRSLAAGSAGKEAVVLPSLQEAILHCNGYEKMFICGGAAIYQEAFAFANKIELTYLNKQYDGDVFFPEIDSTQWVKTSVIDGDGFSFISYNKAET